MSWTPRPIRASPTACVPGAVAALGAERVVEPAEDWRRAGPFDVILELVGASNLAIGVHTAMQDSTPMVVLLGLGFLIGTVGHVYKSRTLQAAGILLIFAATIFLPIAYTVSR